MTGGNNSRIVTIAEIEIDDLSPTEVQERVRGWLDDPLDRARVLVTPNADYVVKAHRDADFRMALNEADLRVPDGMWIVYASRIAGRPLGGTVTGRLLLPSLARLCASTGRTIGLFGAAPGVAQAAAARLTGMIEGLQVTHSVSPPMGLIPGSPQDERLVATIAADAPDILFVGLGAPKQELWMARHVRTFPGCVLVGVGAGIDLIAGRYRTAPAWMTRTGLEWLFRLAQEPRRLAHRYLVDDPWILAWALKTRLRR